MRRERHDDVQPTATGGFHPRRQTQCGEHIAHEFRGRDNLRPRDIGTWVEIPHETIGTVDTVKKVLPLAATRSAKFTTTKGTWLSVDVSPDGQKIIFDLLGDLYTLPIAGGKATRITSGIAYDAQPRWSPDGRQITFISDRTPRTSETRRTTQSSSSRAASGAVTGTGVGQALRIRLQVGP